MKRSLIWLVASTSWLASGIQIDLLLTCLVLRLACALLSSQRHCRWAAFAAEM
jgi:hypothetical protein